MLKRNRCRVFSLVLAGLLLAGGCEGREAVGEPDTVERPAAGAGLEGIAIELGGPGDLDTLVERAAGKRLVLLGESTHGTREFYEWRLEISRRLVLEEGFDFIVFEGDWKPFCAVNRFARGDLEHPGGAAGLLAERFRRWPPWMWGNPVMVDLVEWLAGHNRSAELPRPVGLYGMDVYGHWDSLRAARRYLEQSGREKLVAAAAKYDTFARYEGEDAWAYTRALAAGAESSAEPVGRVLALLEGKGSLLDEGRSCGEYLSALHNALVVRNAEEYYRVSARPGPAGWNSRARHMAETTWRLLDFYGPDSRGIVWAHNTHVGDARATAMGNRGEVNIGQLARERYGRENVYIVGFGTHRGSVRAGPEWGAPGEVMPVPPGRPGTFEGLLGAVSRPAFLLHLAGSGVPELDRVTGHRAIGVVFQPEFEVRNYVPTLPSARYDSFIFITETNALDPLEKN